MAIKIVELFGYAPEDQSPKAVSARKTFHCPFLDDRCNKVLSDGTVSGVCTVRQLVVETPVICCPVRLYADDYRMLSDTCDVAFGPGTRLIAAQDVSSTRHDGKQVAVFGKRWGKELRLPNRGGRGYFVDWILALIGADGKLKEFVAVEVQAIDTTGNYRNERAAYMRGKAGASSPGGINWENVNKRILPQLIYKGHVLRRERLCTKGLFFVCPQPVFERVRGRLGGKLEEYHLQPGALTFQWYDPGASAPPGKVRPLVRGRHFTTTVDQVALAFTSPSNLPPAGVYEEAIEAELALTR